MPAGMYTRPLLHVLASLLVIVALLYWAKAVVIPVVLAIGLTFLLSPRVNALWRRGLARTPAAVLVVLLFACLLGVVGWTIAAQLSSLASELPTYTDNLKQKIAEVQHVGTGSALRKVKEAVEELSRAVQHGTHATPGQQTPIAVQAERPSLVSYFAYLPSLLEIVLTAVMVLVLVVFMLIEQSALRNHLLTLVGHNRVTHTTKALDEVSQRISRYLLMQALLNGGFGVVFGLGLFGLGVPYAILWGLLAAILRFIPYVGTPIAALLPIALSLAVFPGWTQPLLVSGLFVLLDLGTNTVLEPWLYGRSAGISRVALLVAILFWAWLWGPVGLLLSTPLTVCLSVLGKYVPSLAFLGVVLSDEAVEGLNSYYQRLVARDQDEAAAIVTESLQTQSLGEVYDTVLVPALSYAKHDLERDTLTAQEMQAIVRATREIVEDLEPLLSPLASEASAAVEDESPLVPRAHNRVVACPARDEADALALRMFQQVCDPTRYQVELLKVGLLTSDVVALMAQTRPALLCIGAVAPGGVPHLRYLCKQLHSRCPALTIVVGYWGVTDTMAETVAFLRAEGIEQVGTTLRDTCDQVMRVSQQPVSHTPQAALRLV